MKFPEKYLDLFKPETKAFLFLATSMPDGSPQLTPVWIDNDRNMKARSKVAMVIQDPTDPYRYLGIRGEVVSYTRAGADEHIDMLARRYRNRPWAYRPEQKRIISKIKADHFDEH
jgi:hypothetical protein